MLEEALLLNNGPPLVRSPRLRVLVGGQVLTGAFQAEVVSNNHFGADRFSVAAAIGPDSWGTVEFWSSEADFYVEVQVSLDRESGFTSLIQGLTDLISLDPTARTVRLSGRDLSAAFIEARTQEAFANRTSSEIVTILARRRGLVPQVVPTATLVGRYYESSYSMTTLDQFSKATTEWDLLVYLARCERYDVFVRGSTLFFRPTINLAVASQIIRLCDVTKLTLQRIMTLARDVEVTVKSWNSQQQTAITERAQSTVNGAGTASSTTQSRPPQRFILVRPNLTSEAALKLAKLQVEELCRHERVVELAMPGELTLAVGSTILLDGTGTDFDQAYYIDSIERVLRPRTGFVQSMCLKSASSRTDATASTVATT